MDALLLAKFDQVVALQDRMALDLVNSGHYSSAVDDRLELSVRVSVIRSL